MNRYKKLIIFSLVLLAITVDVKASEIDDIKESGTYFVTIDAEDENGFISQKKIRMLITTRNTVINYSVSEAIDGVDLRFYDDNFLNLDNQALIKLGRVHAWNLITGERIGISNITVDVVSKDRSEVTFSTQLGTSITLNAYRTSNVGLSLENNYFKPISKSKYNLPITVKILSILIILPLVALFISFWSTRREYGTVLMTLFNRFSSKDVDLE